MKKFVCQKPVKVLLILLQAVAVAEIMLCLASISFWMEDSYSLGDLSQTFEESDLFFRQIDEILSDKIRGQDNERLLETDGELDRYKQIDIQSYDEVGSTIQDLNTSYLLGDLLDFYENGGWQALHDAIIAASEAGGSAEPGELLDSQSAVLETITPVTGITLAECSRWYSDSAGYIEEMYTLLDEACADLYARYVEYTTIQDESWSAEAPSNLLYCIEDTSTGELYTNTGMDTYDEAVAAAEADEAFTSLYEGERSFNIMVTNPDRVMNAAASEWFLQERFVSTNEKVYLAVDTSYPVSDELQTWADYYAQRETIIRNAGLGIVVWLIALLLMFLGSLSGAGQKSGVPGIVSVRVDEIPTELAAGIYLIVGIGYSLISAQWSGITSALPGEEKYQAAVVAASAWLIFLSACLAFVRRWKAKTLWSNSITRTLLHTWRQVNSSRAASGQLILLYIGFFVLNFVFLLLFDRGGMVLVVLLDMAVLLYLMRDMAGKQNVYEGIHQLSKGDLNYRIDTSALQGESLNMADAVNEMGDSLSKALEAIVKNERLKAELITNVSHDLKTPLTSIVNYVDLLKRENLQDPRVRQYVEILDQKSQRLKQLTEDLVEASKISSGNVELEIVRMQAQSMLLQACAEFDERFEEKGLTISWDMEKEPVYIMADGRQLWRILENLLSNIYKYAKEGTPIRVVLRQMQTEEAVSTSAVFHGEDSRRSDTERNAAHLDGVEVLSAPLRSALNDRPLDDQRPRYARRQDAPSMERNAAHLDGAVEAHTRCVMIALQNVPKEQLTIEADELTGRFVRGDASRSTEGSGLGLSIAQNLTELLDGRFELSTQDGLFTARIYFPVTHLSQE